MKAHQGFTLVEMLIVVALIGILGAIGFPLYTDHVTRGRIALATAELSDKKVRMEQFYQDNMKYTGSPHCTRASTETETNNLFTFSCTVISDTAYTLAATGKNAMKGFVYTINQRGQKATTGVPTGNKWQTNATCWVTKKNGVC